ncbi:hypothetical protein [Janthinobacterium sp.]|uniref:hypothetical protein n=1 Tax=Janthinobacterium sp. TaxID=1871054 RepID=UPI00293D7E06|nr:hypothetical protein [Janthinobacterium sp.]
MPIAADPYSAAFGAAASVASAALDDKTNQTQNSNFGGATFDNSGWNVNIGSGAANNTPVKTTTNSPIASGVGAALATLQNPMVMLAIAAVVYMVLRRK